MQKAKKILSLIVGIPAAIVLCGEVGTEDGYMLQAIALTVLMAILLVNGVFKEIRYDQ